MIRVAIIDDEPRAHSILETYISRTGYMKLEGSFLNAIAAHEFLRTHETDVIFLDITMPEVNGFQLLQMLDKPPLVIFTTAHPEFALESYDYDAVDYLKKPIPYERFAKACAKAAQLVSASKQFPSFPDRIELRIDGSDQVILFQDILYFQSLGNYVKVITLTRTYFTQITTMEIERCLPRAHFVRIHKSYIANRAKISSLSDDEVTIGTSKLPIGKTYKKYVREVMN